MKVGIFTDSHYSSEQVTCETRFNNKSLRKIEEALSFFKAEKCDRIICLGDLIDHEDDHTLLLNNLQSIAILFRATSLKYTVLMGNHDCFSLTQNEFYSIIGDEARPTPFIFENKTVIFMDACYYSNGEHYSPEKSHDWMDTNCQSPTKLQEELKAVNGFCYIFIHQNLDPDIPESCRLNNDKTVRKILEDSGKVITVFQGHYHLGNKKRVNGIEYITIPAMCENEKAFFIYQL